MIPTGTERLRTSLTMRIGLMTIGVFGCLILAACEAEGPPLPTPTPVLQVEVPHLWDVRELNATKFDENFRGRWIHVSGTVREIEGGEVRLYAENPGWIDWFTKMIVLHDLPRQHQATAVKEQHFSATCKVGNKFWNRINLRECTVEN